MQTDAPPSDQKARLIEAADRGLPPNYNFELAKTLRRIHEQSAKRVCLQFPEGLLLWAETIALIIEEFVQSVEDVILIGDVTYGACCVDDIKAISLKCDFLVHYAHSCLIPIDAVSIACLYVFVEIALDTSSIASTLCQLLPAELTCGRDEQAIGELNEEKSMAILGTIQYSGAVHSVAEACRKSERFNGWKITVNQVSPLTPGEVLGCTSPALETGCRCCVFIADGRFHLESAMIQNPHVKFYRYDPITKNLFREYYDHDKMKQLRWDAIIKAREADLIFIILSTLGRQGSVGVLEYLKQTVEVNWPGIEVVTLLIPEIQPDVLKRLAKSETGRRIAFVQVGCPRLSIDWGHEACEHPLLSPYEANVAFREISRTQLPDVYPMDYFSAKGGVWSNYGRDGNRNGSLQSSQDAQTTKERLKQKWLQRKIEMQNAK